MSEQFLPLTYDLLGPLTAVRRRSGFAPGTTAESGTKSHSTRTREDHIGDVRNELTDLLGQLASTGLFNHGNETQEPQSIAQLPDIQAIVREQFYSPDGPGRAVVLLPFHTEGSTIAGCAEYAMAQVGKPNVLAVSTGRQPESYHADRARETGANVIEQSTLLQAIDWSRLRQLVHIHDGDGRTDPIGGSKGLTVLAGIIALTAYAEAGRTQQNPIVMLHDTDVTNPGTYGGLPLALAPYAFDESFLMSAIAKNGLGRNNEPIFGSYSNFLSSDEESIRAMGGVLGRLVWPLTGERALRLHTLQDIPFAASMGLETVINMYVAARESGHTGETTLLAQVLDPAAKVENAVSTYSREFKMITSLAEYGQRIKRHMEERTPGRLFDEWTVEDIAAFNRGLEKRPIIAVVPAEPTELRHNTIEQIAPDYILPSVRTMIELGILDMAKVRTALGI